MQCEGFDLKMFQFVVSASIFYQGNIQELFDTCCFFQSSDFQVDTKLLLGFKHLLSEQNWNIPLV